MPNHTPAIHRLSGAIALVLAAGLGLGAAQAQAATLTVTSRSDPGNTGSCTLRQAISTVNHGAAAGSDEGTCRARASGSFGSDDRIVFDTGAFPPGDANTITLAGSRLAISATDLDIDASANGNVTIDANHASGVMIDSAATDGALHISHLTLRNGEVANADCLNEKSGGGLCIPHAQLTLDNSTISGNSATRGGGIASGSGHTTLTNSTISGNSASDEGGGIFFATSHVTLTNSTVSGNSADNGGGGIFSEHGTLTLANSTISGNSANRRGGGVYADGGFTLVTSNNTIISANAGGDASGFLPSGSHNLIGSVANLNLGPLADNGGLTQTMLPQAGSAAIDAGDDSLCPATDQRGFPRPQVGCDIGAVEAVAPGQIVAVNGSGQSTSAWHDFFNPITVQVLDPAMNAGRGVPLHATSVAPNQASATCTDAVSNATGFAYIYCRANGIAGSYTVEVSAVGWPAVAPATFVLTNVDDGDTLFRDGFELPGPRTSMLTADTADAAFALRVPGHLPDNQPEPLHLVTNTDRTPLLRVDGVARNGQPLLRVVRYAHGKPLPPGAWQTAGRAPRLRVQRRGHAVEASIRCSTTTSDPAAPVSTTEP